MIDIQLVKRLYFRNGVFAKELKNEGKSVFSGEGY